MVEETDVAVIGAGPSGLIAAQEASRMGLRVVVLEEHGEIGLPCHCAGLLSIRGLCRIGVPSSGVYTLNMIRGAHLFSPSKISITVEWESPVACVVNRHLFDLFLASEARRRGSLIMLGARVKRAYRRGDGWLLETSGGDAVKAKVLIDAEGATPRIPQMVGLKTHGAERLLKGIQADLSVSSLSTDYVEVYFGRNIAPGLFAWVIPLNDEVVRVGLACKTRDIREKFTKFVERRFKRTLKELKPIKYFTGLIITCGPIERTYSDGLLIVGDSAGHTKPITGGGVIFGGLCAKIAGRVASRAILSDNVSGEFLKAYEESWRSMIGGELKIALLIRRILDRFSDRDIDKIFLMALREKVHEKIVLGADMDYQAITLMKTLRARILKFIPMALSTIIGSVVGEGSKYIKGR
ncbi:MAG: NAD(P)/FAD-dependent oxidoreductase [Candidatus Bathyarchaeia archaeon]